MKNVIIITRMYAGRYLDYNVGHEVINLYKSDNGNNYIYITKEGFISEKYNDRVRAVLLTRRIEDGVMEVIGKAEELEQVLYKDKDINTSIEKQMKYIDNQNIRYGGERLYNLFGNIPEEKISITFKTKKLLKVKSPLYIIEDQDKYKQYENAVLLPDKHFADSSLKMYYDQLEFPESYDKLNKILCNNKYWEKTNTTSKVNANQFSDSMLKRNFLYVINKEYDELIFSSLFAYIFRENVDIFLKFLNEVLNIKNFDSNYTLERETYNNIDLFIYDDKNTIVIENKIKSKINGQINDVKSDSIRSQLSKYKDAVENDDKHKSKHHFYFIFSPDYNSIKLERFVGGYNYKIIKYSQIYEFYSKNASKMLYINYFTDFLSSIYLHTKSISDLNYDIMRARLIDKIQKNSFKNKQ